MYIIRVLDQYATIIALAILYYDYTLTFAAEVERYWKKNWSHATVLFFINRYVPTLGGFWILFQSAWEIYHVRLIAISLLLPMGVDGCAQKAECRAVQLYRLVFSMTIQIAAAGILNVVPDLFQD